MTHVFYTCRKAAALAALLLSSQMLISSMSFAQDEDSSNRYANYPATKISPQEIESMVPKSPNPWLSLLPDGVEPDWEYWKMKQEMDASARSSSTFSAEAQMQITGGRALPFTILPRFGTRPWQDGTVNISVEASLPAPTMITPLAEDEGAIPLATDINLTPGTAIRLDSVIGDGAFGSAGTQSGDLDFYAIRDVKAGQLITVDIDTPDPFGALDPFVEIRDSEGVILGANDDGNAAVSFDSLLLFVAPADGDYFVSVAGFGTFSMTDPFDSSTGLGNIFGLPLDEGVYTATFGLDYIDETTLLFIGRPGDAIGAGASGGMLPIVSIIDGDMVERQGSGRNAAFITPENSPVSQVPGTAVATHVVDNFGFYRVAVQSLGNDPYSIALQAAKPTLAQGVRGDVQTIFIDFDGETVDLSESIDRVSLPGENVVTLSPLSASLSNWGLTAADEDAVIDAILAVVEQSLVRDIKTIGKNRRFKIKLLNSRDHQDPFGMDNVSRVIVGGTRAELGRNTIGIAQSIDVGNFDTEETAFVLLDVLSSTDPLIRVSLNNFPIDPSKTIVDLIGVGVGEIVAHEAGHYLGNWHTDQFNDQANIMDQGGNLPFSILGLGPDGIFGTADDDNVMFGADVFNPAEGFSGIENTLTSINWGATRPSPFFFIHSPIGEENAATLLLEQQTSK